MYLRGDHLVSGLVCHAFTVGEKSRQTGDHTMYGITKANPLAVALPLTDRETEILRLLSRGLSNKAIAQSLHVSPETVKMVLKQLYRKLRVNNRTQAVVVAMRAGFLH